MYKIGDKFDISVRIDPDTIINQDLIITYVFSNIIITCGHCLPENAIVPNGKILYTSGFDNPDENQEIGIIEINNMNLRPEYKLLEKRKLNKLIRKNYLCSNSIKLLNQSKSYNFEIINIFDIKSFSKLKPNQLNPYQPNPYQPNPYQPNPYGDFYWLHSITKIIDSNSNFFNIFDLSHVAIAYSNSNYETINKSVSNTLYKIASDNNWIIDTDKYHYVTKPSYSGSPYTIQYKNDKYIIGYHIGSTLGIRVLENKIVWVGKIVYIKLISLV